MRYSVIVKGFDSGLNELLEGKFYDCRTKTYVNVVKKKNDQICLNALRLSPDFRKLKIKNPVVIHYLFYCKNKKRDRMNVGSAFDKSFQDALQKYGTLENDGWNDVLGTTMDFRIDKDNPRVIVCVEEVKAEPELWKGWNDTN